MARNRDPPTKPRRRTYVTGGETLPELTDEFRPIPLGYDEEGEPDGQIRAFAVNVRNQSDRNIYIREGPEDGAGDAAVIGRFENYTIYENNGVNRILLRGEEGGEEVEIRTLEAHNDFNIRDRIEAFVRAISHFFATSKQETVITDSETVIATNITDSEAVFDTTIGEVTEGVLFDTNITGSDVTLPIEGQADVTIEDIAEGVIFDVDGDVDATIGDIAEGVTFDSNIVGSEVNLDTTIGEVAEGVTVDTNISASDVQLDVNLSGSEVTQSIDIEAQTVGDINTLPRVGEETTRFLEDTESAGYIDETFNQYVAERHDWTLYDSAAFDGEIRHIWIRLTPGDDEDFSPSRLDTLGFSLRVNDELVSPTYLVSGWSVQEYNQNGAEAYISRYDPRHELVYGWEPKGGKVPTFTVGDEVKLVIGTAPSTHRVTGGSTQDFDVEAEVMVTERIGE